MATLPPDFGKQLAEALKSGKATIQVVAMSPASALSHPIQSITSIFDSMVSPLKKFADILKIIGAAKLANTPGPPLPRFMGMGPQKFGPATPPTQGAATLGMLASGAGKALGVFAIVSKIVAVIAAATAAFTLLVTAVKAAAKSFAEFSAPLTHIFAQADVRQIFRSQKIGAQIAPFVGPLVAAIEDMKDAFMPLLVDVFKFISTILKPMVQAVSKVVVPLLQTAFDMMKGFFTGVLYVMSFVFKAISAAITFFVGFMQIATVGATYLLGLTDAGRIVSDAIDEVIDGIDKMIEELKDKPGGGNKDWVAPGIMMLDPHRPAFRKPDRKVGPAKP